MRRSAWRRRILRNHRPRAGIRSLRCRRSRTPWCSGVRRKVKMRRREFIKKGSVGAAALAFCKKTGWNAGANSRTADSRIDVLIDEPLGTISPNIYGHFTENLGGVFYDGIWVGEQSRVANV